MSAAAATKYQTLHRHKHKRRSTEIATIFPLFARSLSLPRAFLAFLAFPLHHTHTHPREEQVRMAAVPIPARGSMRFCSRKWPSNRSLSRPGQPPSKAGSPKAKDAKKRTQYQPWHLVERFRDQIFVPSFFIPLHMPDNQESQVFLYGCHLLCFNICH